MKARITARAVLFDPANRVLLFQFVLPAGFIAEGPVQFWATPGGEIEQGEDARDAVAREVIEETGIQSVEIGAEIWFGSNILAFKGQATKTFERFYYARSATALLGATNWTDIEREVMRDHRWWTIPELIAAKETIFPPRFGYLVDRFLRCGTNGPEEISL